MITWQSFGGIQLFFQNHLEIGWFFLVHVFNHLKQLDEIGNFRGYVLYLLSDDQTRVGEFFRKAYDWHVEMFHQLGLEGLDTFCHKLVTESIEIGSWILWSFTLVQVRLKRFSSARLTVSFFQSRLILLRRSAPPTTQRILGSCWQR